MNNTNIKNANFVASKRPLHRDFVNQNTLGI